MSFPVREPVNKKDPDPHPIHQNTIKESPKNPEERGHHRKEEINMTNLALPYNRAASEVSKRKVTPQLSSAYSTQYTFPDRIGLTSPLAPTPLPGSSPPRITSKCTYCFLSMVGSTRVSGRRESPPWIDPRGRHFFSEEYFAF
mmetsp:Transcript_24972/g.60120  ORF Transcript_24972/g.60120 Transcript_24972/m.60120 type:complete len:143 (+) Transcript_24972:346-774(+)